MKELPIFEEGSDMYERYEAKFKALADARRLRIMSLLVKHGKVCVCDLAMMLDMPQSKLSYHLKILLDQNLILVDTRGKWNDYQINLNEVNHILSEELCCLFRLDRMMDDNK
ncbi:winged helix-turn-helix transcriptional regulator [Tumebacillus sp. ITR2]|uniref:Winged helix-turn-helix transcriptional regulator n=1 Tax=Tumebacillus amylolyticus TaxID=2801339 RepID=A0ABS1J5P9_9BACL|nr:metalloregulator ArsR/SmtB family transcription factor [Tumebacillus amylolyticus]MBL0385602.1 winged helix-turn-helix transcriptional regulator [Tumebacillus amylolyticus]